MHSSTTFEQNLFQQFLIGSRAGDVEPSALHINLAKQQNDNVLLAQLYNKNASGQYLGSPAGVSAGSNVSTFAISPEYRQLIVSNAENLLLRAEAEYRLGQTSSSGPAAVDLATEHTNYEGSGSPTIPGGTNGLLIGILQEKFVRLFLSPEVYFDYLRTCVPERRASGEPHGRIPVRPGPFAVQLYRGRRRIPQILLQIRLPTPHGRSIRRIHPARHVQARRTAPES